MLHRTICKCVTFSATSKQPSKFPDQVSWQNSQMMDGNLLNKEVAFQARRSWKHVYVGKKDSMMGGSRSNNQAALQIKFADHMPTHVSWQKSRPK